MSVTKKPRLYRVLVVDDLDHQRTAIITAISQVVHNCKFIEAENVTTAQRILSQILAPFDLAVIDVRLEETDKDGIGLAKVIRERYPETHVIVVTAYPAVETACKAYEDAGASSYLSKLDENLTERIQSRARKLLEDSDVRKNLRRQHQALRDAEEALKKNSQEWTRKYGGQFVLVYNGEVIGSSLHCYELRDVLNDYARKNSCNPCDTAIVKVSTSEKKENLQ